MGHMYTVTAPPRVVSGLSGGCRLSVTVSAEPRETAESARAQGPGGARARWRTRAGALALGCERVSHLLTDLLATSYRH